MFVYKLFIFAMVASGTSVAIAGIQIAYTMQSFPVGFAIGAVMFLAGLFCVILSITYKGL